MLLGQICVTKYSTTFQILFREIYDYNAALEFTANGRPSSKLQAHTRHNNRSS